MDNSNNYLLEPPNKLRRINLSITKKIRISDNPWYDNGMQLYMNIPDCWYNHGTPGINMSNRATPDG